MTTARRIRRGTDLQHESFAGLQSELTHNTDSNRVHVHDGTTIGGHALALKSDVDNSNRPAFAAHKGGTDQSLTKDTWTKVTFDIEDLDQDGAFTDSRFTPGVAGKYFISANVTILTSILWAAIYVNGAVTTAAQGYGSAHCSAMLNLNADDYVEVFVSSGDEGKSVTGTSLAGMPLTVFHGHRLGGA